MLSSSTGAGIGCTMPASTQSTQGIGQHLGRPPKPLPTVCSTGADVWCNVAQDQTDEVQNQPGWMQDGEEGEGTGESSPLPAVPMPGQGRQPGTPAASQPSGDLLSLGGDTPRAGANGSMPQSEALPRPCSLS